MKLLTWKQKLSRSLRLFGIDIIRYQPSSHPQARLLRLIESSGIGLVVDVGANGGQYGGELREGGYRGKIVSYEPLSEAYKTLAGQCAGDSTWEARQLALGAEPGSAEINIAANSTSSSLLEMLPTHLSAAPHSRYIGSEIIRVDTVDRQLPTLGSWNGEIWLKVDTQGFEGEVLKGAVASLPKIRCVQLEMSLAPLYGGSETFESLLATMKAAGYRLVGLQPGFMNQETGELLQVDGIFRRIESR